MIISQPGLYFDVPAEDYFADPCIEPSLTQSVAKILIDQSPLHAKLAHPRYWDAPRADDDGYDKAQAIGNAAHALILGRGKKLAVIDAPDFRKKDAKEAKEKAIAAKQEPILSKHFDMARDLVASFWLQLRQIEGCEKAFHEDHGQSEVVGVAQDGELYLRTMIDWLSTDRRLVLDLKTVSASASPFVTGRKMASDGWMVQAAMHERVLDAVDPAGAGRRRFLYVCVEQQPPYALTVNEIGEAPLTIGRKMLQYAIETWRRCVEDDVWPAYPLRIIRPEMPAWAENGWINREIAEYEAAQEVQRTPMLTDLSGG